MVVAIANPLDLVTGLLHSILCAILGLAATMADLLVMLANALIVAIGAALAFFLGLLPAMPDPPTPPTSGVLGLINWIVPLAPMLAFTALAVSLWLTFLAIKVVLNWLRAL